MAQAWKLRMFCALVSLCTNQAGRPNRTAKVSATLRNTAIFQEDSNQASSRASSRTRKTPMGCYQAPSRLGFDTPLVTPKFDPRWVSRAPL